MDWYSLPDEKLNYPELGLYGHDIEHKEFYVSSLVLYQYYCCEVELIAYIWRDSKFIVRYQSAWYIPLSWIINNEDISIDDRIFFQKVKSLFEKMHPPMLKYLKGQLSLN